jgi:hypothetical protein
MADNYLCHTWKLKFGMMFYRTWKLVGGQSREPSISRLYMRAKEILKVDAMWK